MSLTVEGPPLWSDLGPNQLRGVVSLPCGGRVDGIDVSPNYDGQGHAAMYLATPGGGVWRSADFTSSSPTWRPLTDHLPGFSPTRRVSLNVISTLAVDLTAPRTVYAQAGGSPAGLLKTTDGGETWALVGAMDLAGAAGLWHVMVDGQGAVYAAFAQGGFWRSVNGGLSWTDVTPPNLRNVEFQAASWTMDGTGVTVYCGVVDRRANGLGGIWSFRNGQWTQMPMTLTNMRKQAFSRDAITRITVSRDPATGVCFSLSQAQDAIAMVELLNLFTLSRGTWTPRWFSDSIWFITQGGYCQGVCIAPDGRLYGGGIGLGQSSGASGVVGIGTDAQGNQIHVDQHAIASYQGLIYVGTDGGVFRCRPRAGASGVDAWVSLNSPSLANALSTGASVHPADPSVVLVGNQDNGIARRSGSGQWDHSGFSNEREKLRFDPHGPNPGSFAFSGDPNNGFYWSNDHGVTFNGFQPAGVPAPDPPPPFAIHTTDAARLIIAWPDIYETRDRGGTWVKLRSVVGFPTAVTYAGAHVAYVAIGATLMETFDDGATWNSVLVNFGGAIMSLCADAANPDAIYLATPSRVMCRPTPTSPWEDHTGNLSLGIAVLALLPTGGGARPWLFVGTGAGVFVATRLAGAATQWVRFGSGLPDAQVTDLEVTRSTHLLLAATWGRGSWAVRIGAAPAAVKISVSGGGACSPPVEGSTLSARLDRIDGLVSPFKLQWSATNANILGPVDQETIHFVAPASGITAEISLTVTDAEGSALTAVSRIVTVTERMARFLDLLCQLRKMPNFPIDPLGDPLRDFPIRPLTRLELTTVRELAVELSELTATMVEGLRTPAVAIRDVGNVTEDSARPGEVLRAPDDLAETARVRDRTRGSSG